MSQRADAASDRCSYTASAPPSPATAFTVTMWARLRVDRDDFSTMMRLHSSSGGSTTVNITTGSSGTTPIVVSPGNTGGIVGSDALAVDTWRMIAVTCAGTGATDSKIYTKTIGGSTNVATGEVSGGAAPDGLTLFGRSAGDSTEWFNGGLAYVRVWSAVLSQADIEAEWASATVVRTSGLWANWPLATNLNDISGNGRNLTAGSTALSTEDDPPLGVSGTAVANLGGLTATAAGVRTVSGAAAASLGVLTGTAAGTRTVTGAAAATLGGLTGTATGTRTVLATANAALGVLAATIVGRVSLRGTASASLGGLTATATVAAPQTVSIGSWDTLLAITKEARQLAAAEDARQPQACPNDGEPLQRHRGVLHCAYDGWTSS